MKTFFKIAILVMSVIALPVYAVTGPSVDSVKKEVESTFSLLSLKHGIDLNTRQGRRTMAGFHMEIFNVNRPVTKAVVGIFYIQENGFDVGGMYATETRGFVVNLLDNNSINGKYYVYRVVFEKSVNAKGSASAEVFQVYAHEVTGDGFSRNFIRLTDSQGLWNNDVYQYHWTNFPKVISALRDIQRQIRYAD